MAHYISEHLDIWQKKGQVILEKTDAREEYSMALNTMRLADIFEKAQKNN